MTNLLNCISKIISDFHWLILSYYFCLSGYFQQFSPCLYPDISNTVCNVNNTGHNKVMVGYRWDVLHLLSWQKASNFIFKFIFPLMEHFYNPVFPVALRNDTAPFNFQRRDLFCTLHSSVHDRDRGHVWSKHSENTGFNVNSHHTGQLGQPLRHHQTPIRNI